MNATRKLERRNNTTKNSFYGDKLLIKIITIKIAGKQTKGCHPFSISRKCCFGIRMRKYQLCNESTEKPVNKTHPSHNSICGSKTYKKGNQVRLFILLSQKITEARLLILIRIRRVNYSKETSKQDFLAQSIEHCNHCNVRRH